MNNSLTIYLAEDDIDDQELLQEALLSINPHIQLISFTNGIKFIEHLKTTSNEALPCLIVLDYNIPELNGAEILQALNEDNRYSDIVKVIWSTSDSHYYQKSCLDLGAKAYLVKPSSIAGIKDMAHRMLSLCEAS